MGWATFLSFCLHGNNAPFSAAWRNPAALKAAKRLLEDGVRVCLTACYSAKQALIATGDMASLGSPYGWYNPATDGGGPKMGPQVAIGFKTHTLMSCSFNFGWFVTSHLQQDVPSFQLG